MLIQPRLKINVIGFSIHSFHFFGVLGFIMGALLGVLICYAAHLQVSIILYMTLTGALTFFILAFVAKIITGKEYIVYYHHEIAILLMCSAVLKLLGQQVLPYIDITILGIATFLSFGRIGCFSVGCCHGKPAKKGVTYTHDHVKAGFTWYYEGITLLPVQLIESVFVFTFILTGTYLLIYKHLQAGTILILYTVVYGCFRFIIEFFRGDAERPYFNGLSEAQWTTLFLIIVSLILSYAGLLPLYSWHIIIFLLILLWSGFMVMRSSVTNNFTQPDHIRQIAKALIELENESSAFADRIEKMPVRIVKTESGLYLSKGIWLQNGKSIKHYTLSFKDGQVLTASIVSKLAGIIRYIDKNEGSFTVRKKDKGVFQIVFENEALTEQDIKAKI